MPVKKNKKQNNEPKKLGRKALARISKMANAYSVYQQRLNLRTTITEEEKINHIKQFMENYKDDTELLTSEDEIKVDTDENALKAMGLSGTSLDFIKSWQAFKKQDPNFKFGFAADGTVSYDEAKKELNKRAEAGAAENKEDDDLTVNEEQAKGLRDIAKWMYRNSEDRTAARRGSAHLGKKDHSIFIEELLAKSAKQRLLIFYLVEKGRTNKCTAEDVVNSQSYIPDLEAFKKKIHKAGIKRLFVKDSIKWDLLGQAVQSAGVSISSLSKLTERDPNENPAEKIKDFDIHLNTLGMEEKDREEAIQQRRVTDPALSDKLRMLPLISAELRDMLDNGQNTKGTKDPQKADKSFLDKNRYEKLINALIAIKKSLADELKKTDDANENAHAAEDPKSTKDKTKPIFKKLGDALTKLPLTGTMAAGTAVGSCAIILKVANLIKDRSILSAADVSERALSLLASCADVSANASKLGLITAAMNTGNMLNVAAASSTATVVGAALGVVSGGLSMSVAAVQAGRADSLRKGVNKAGGYLDSMSKNDSDDAVMAGNIKGLASSMHYLKALSAGKNMVAGTLTALGGAFTLTGVGAIGGLALMGAGLAINLVMGIVSKVKTGGKILGIVDDYLGLDNIMAQLKIPTRTDKEKEAAMAIRSQLRLYGEAKMGAASHAQAAKIIMSRYSHFLWRKVFKDEKGQDREESYYSNKSPGTDEEKLAYACKELVSSMGVKIRFGANGTKEEEIRRRMTLS